MNKVFLNKTFFYLPWIILCLACIGQVMVFALQTPEYKHDETILTVISRQNLSTSLNTITAELHPPGFYLLLKLFPTLDIATTRLGLAALVFLLLFSLLVFLYKSQLVQTYKLIGGLSLLFASYGFLEITSTIKQEMISLPLLLWSFFIALYTQVAPAKKQFVLFLLLNSISLLILGTGYIYYFISLISIALLYLNNYKNKKYTLTVLIHVAISIIYVYAYGFQQIINNLNRFSWHEEHYNSFFRGLSIFLNGNVFASFYGDICVFIFLCGIVALCMYFKKLPPRIRTLTRTLCVITFLLTVGYFVTNLYVRPRYVFPLFALLSLLSGWGLIQTRLAKPLVISFSFLLLLLNMTVLSIPREYQLLNEQLRTLGEEHDQIGLIDEHALYPYIFRINNPDLTNIIPINIFHYSDVQNYDDFSKDQIMYEGLFEEKTEAEFAVLFKETGLTRFTYRMQSHEKTAYYDPKRTILNTLAQSCDLTKVSTLDYRNTFFEFKNCNF